MLGLDCPLVILFFALLPGSLHSRFWDMPLCSCCGKGEFWGFCFYLVAVKLPVFCFVYPVSCFFYVVINAG